MPEPAAMESSRTCASSAHSLATLAAEALFEV